MTSTEIENQITPGERRELRSVVRAQMKVLRAEVTQREAELLAEAEARLTERFAEQDKLLADARERARKIAEDANRALADGIRELVGSGEDGRTLRCNGFYVPNVWGQTEDRAQLRKAMESGVKARVRQAKTELDRQEADLLRDLAVDALRTDAARAFLARIPTAAQLVPSSRLSEIEAEFDSDRS